MATNEENVYSQILDGEGEDQASSLKQSMFVASKTQPDTAAQDQSLAKQTGLPADVVSRNKDTIQKQATVDSIDYGYLIDKNPGLSNWLKEPDNASIGHDDLDVLGKHENIIKGYNVFESFWKSLNSGVASTNAMIFRTPALAFDLAMLPGNNIRKALGQSDKQVRSPEWLRNNPIAKYYDAQAEAWRVPEMDKSIIEQTMKGDYAGAGKSLFSQLIANAPQQAIILASGVLGKPMHGLGYAGVTQAASANKVAQESGVDPASATTDAIMQGSAEALFERAGTLGVLRKWENAIAKAVGKQSAKQVIKEVGKTILYSGLAEGNEEFLTQASQDFADYVTGVNPDGLKGILQRSIDAGIIGAASGVAMTSPTAIASGRAKGQEIKRAEQAKKFYLDLGDASKLSKLRERMPDAHSKYVSGLVKDTPVENIYIPVDDFDTFMQSKGVDPSAAASEIGVSLEYDQAKEIGKDIKIPLATWANKVVGTEYYQGLADDIKFDPAGQTVREAKIASEQLRADIEKASKDAEQAAQSEVMTPEAQKIVTEQADQVAKNVAEQLKATGRFSDEDIKHLSGLWGNFSRVFGGRQGMLPLDYYQKNPLSVKASDSIEARPGQTELNQDASAFAIGDQVEYQEPGGKFYTGRIKKINGNMATIYNDAAKKSYKVNLTLANKKGVSKYNQFAGPESMTAPLAALDRANIMSQTGNTNEQIRQDTGWFKGMDGKWRYEISDQDVLVNDVFANRDNNRKDLSKKLDLLLKEKGNKGKTLIELSDSGNQKAIDLLKEYDDNSMNKEFTLKEVYNHPKLYAAYPDLANIKVKFIERGGSAAASFNPKTNVIELNERTDQIRMTQSLVHEIQHAIQEKENFARGGNVTQFMITESEAKVLKEKIDTLNNALKELAGKEVYEIFDTKTGEIVAEAKSKQEAIDKTSELQSKETSGRFFDYDTVYNRVIEERNSLSKQLIKGSYSGAYDQYARLAGEIEARDSAQRAFMNDAQRKDQAPDLFNNATIVFGGKEFNLINPVNNAPEGKLSSKAFREWFGGSKIVDENGKPLIVYHGSYRSDINAFDPNLSGDVLKSDWGKGIYFTPSKFMADGYREGALKTKDIKADLIWKEMEQKSKEYGTKMMYWWIDLRSGKISQEQYNKLEEIDKRWRDRLNEIEQSKNDGGVYGVYLSIKNPLIYTYGGITEPNLDVIAKESGKDGIIIKSEDGDIEEIIAFYPEQIKSIDNKGTFSMYSANIYNQGDIPLGAILFGKEGVFDMRLLKDMNYSTFLHETGHAFLEMLRRVASQADAPADIQDMSEKTLKWFGIESWDQLERKHHEQFAQGFEKYLFEGKAPSEGLRAAFARFRVWLISVYKSLQGINVQLSDDIRGVMDRMIATDDEIAQAQAEQGLDPMIQDPLSILGEEKGKRYIDAINETRQEAEATLQLKLMEDYQRARKSWWMDELKKVHAQVAQEVNARPEQIALSILQRGKMPDGTDVPEDMKGLKIGADDLVRFYSNKYDIDVTATDTTALAAEFDVEQLEGTLRDIEQFRKDVGKVRKYDDGYLAEELAKMPRRYVTASKFANTLDETASSMGFESDMALLDRMIENEIAYKSVSEELVLARKKLRSINKEERAVKYKAIKDAMSALPRGITSKDGLSVHVVGQLFGYSFPEQFLDILSRTPKRNDLIKQIAIDRMVDQYGQLYGDKQEMHDQAMQAIHNEKREQLLRMELDYLASQHTPVLKDLIKTVSARIPSSQMVKKYAADIIGKSALNEISPYQYQLAERRSAKAAGVALTQGKFDEAFEHKRKELLNYELYRAATTAREDIKKAMTDFKKISKSDSAIAKNRDLDYVNAARSILAMYGIGEGSEDPYQFIKNTQAYDPDTFETISALIDSATENVGNYLTITYDQFSNLKEAIDAIWEIARRTRQIQIEDQKMDIDEVRKHLIDRIQVMTKKEKAGYTKSASENDKFARAIMGAIAQGRRVESWVDVMDGGDSKGWFTRAIWNPIVEGTQRFRIENKNYTQKFLELVKPIEKTLTNKEIVSDELRHIFQSKAELLGALLHTGNESNLSKLLRGRGWGMYLEDGTLDTGRWDAFIKRMQDTGVLTKQDYDFVQSIWDLFEELKPASQKAHKEMYGHYFNSITTREFTTPWGTYRGGYAPAIADPFVSEDAAIRQEKNDAEQTNNSYMFPTTGRGFTKGRVERYAAPLAMDLRLVPQHINKVLRFTYIEPRVKDVGRIIRNQEFREFLRDLDPVVGQQMLSPWLQRAAQQIIETPDKSWAGWRVWRELRTRSGINIMAGNVVNTLQQFTGLSIAAIKVHPKYLRNSLWNYMRNPKSVSDAVHEQSEFMRTRSTTHIIEIQKNIDDIILNQAKYSKALDFAKQHGYFLQQATQNIVDLIVWPGAYDQSVAQGNSHDQAVRDADAAVRLTQGDFSAENVSNIESGNALARMFMMFYSYFNMQANLLGTEFAKVSRELGLKRGAGRALYIYMFGFMIPAVVSELIVKALSGEDWDKDDDGYLDDALSIFFGSQFRTATAMFPFVGQLTNAAVNKFNKKWYDDDIRTSPAISMIESAVHSPYSVYKAISDEGNKKTAIRDTLSLLSILSGLPVSPLSRPLGYLSEVSEGNVYPENALDFSRGLITGKTGK